MAVGMSVSVWYQVVVVYDKSTVLVYVNGVYQGSGGLAPGAVGQARSSRPWPRWR